MKRYIKNGIELQSDNYKFLYRYSGYVVDKITKRKLELRYDYKTVATSDKEAMRNIKYQIRQNPDEIITGNDLRKVEFCPECLYVDNITTGVRLRPIESSESVSFIENVAKDVMKDQGCSTCCNLVAQKVEEESGMKDIDNFILLSSDGRISQYGNHHVNMSKDGSAIYDFTGDQFTGDPYTSEVWKYGKVADRVFMSQNREPFDDIEYVKKYIEGNDENTIVENFLSNPPDDVTMMIVL